jgi:hypothetical protein
MWNIWLLLAGVVLDMGLLVMVGVVAVLVVC